MKNKLPSYGGQAVIEGVMMRGAQVCAIAVRSPDQSIVVEIEPLSGIYRSRITKIPFLRGLIILWDTLVLGVHALTFSANMQAEEGEELEGGPMVLTVLISIAIGVGFFILLPASVAHFIGNVFHWSPFGTNLFEGFIRVGLLIGYIWAIGFMPDIRRVFSYHCAEHKTIHAFEADAPLEIESITRFPCAHPRCGTAFLLTVAAFSILIFSILGPLPLLYKLVSRILLVPILASLSYEYIRLSSKWIRYWWARPLFVPNLLLQRLTTREPEPSMVEVAIAAFKAMREKEEELSTVS
jgi:uncharacterized protein YqhQ